MTDRIQIADPSTTIEACGCVTTVRPRSSVRWRQSCRRHSIATFAFDMLHEWGGHEDCCDIPNLRRKIDECGWTPAELVDATDLIGDRGTREYARRLLTRDEFRYPQVPDVPEVRL